MMFEIKDADFMRLANFMLAEYGVNLTKKKHLIDSRLTSVMATGRFKDFASYVDYVTSGKASVEDMRILVNKLTTNHTYFMRETSHFDFFKDTVLPELEQKYKNGTKLLSIWSAGCSSGQEPYTLCMLLFDYFGNERSKWDLRILATDISNHVMSIAKAAAYNEEDIKDLPQEWKEKYMKKTGEIYTFIPEIRKNVIFKEFNLMNPIRFKIPFDVIFCRNVMIYFEGPTKEAIVRRFYDASNEDAYLFIGQSETLNKEATKYKYVMPAVYKK
jgi:chemotaxis protein methyltransferase CheR